MSQKKYSYLGRHFNAGEISYYSKTALFFGDVSFPDMTRREDYYFLPFPKNETLFLLK